MNNVKIICSACGGELEPVLTISGDIKVYECKKCGKHTEFLGNKQLQYA